MLDAAGIGYTSDEEEAAARADSFDVQPVPGMDGVLGGSTWQSLTRGTGNVETDYLNGELVRIARRHGQEAPINATVAALVRQAAGRGTRPGDMTRGASSAGYVLALAARTRIARIGPREAADLRGTVPMPDATQPSPRREPGERARLVALPGGQAGRRLAFLLPERGQQLRRPRGRARRDRPA